jgi:SAM-dependent methyltransferase
MKIDKKVSALLNIIRGANPLAAIGRALVVGCGDGLEAAVLAETFNCHVTAIDIEDNFKVSDSRVHFRLMDARIMDLDSCSFDFVYSFHALEHIREPMRAIKEISRVLVNNGIYCIGTPNRNRLIGYIGSSDASWRDKFIWNVIDWKARLSGRFKNELGAHAGFAAGELLALCSAIGLGKDISDQYYEQIYPRYSTALATIRLLHLQTIAWPAVYIVGHRSALRSDSSTAVMT